MLATLIIWGYVFLFACIYGYTLVRRIPFLAPLPEAGQPPVTIVVMIGLAILSAIASLLSLAINIGLAANLLIFLTGLALCFWQRRVILQFLLEKIQALRQMHWLSCLAFLTVLLVVLLKSTQPAQNYDTGLYHAQAIRWIETYRAIPGLGNLYDRLVFNASSLLLSALFSFAFLGLQSFHTLNGFLAVLITGYALGKFDRLFHKGRPIKQRITLSNITAVFLPFLLRRIFSLELSSPGTDLPAALMIWIVVMLSMEKIDEQASAYFDFNFLAVLLLSFFSITIKLSTLPILLLPLYFFLRQAGRARRPALTAAAALACCLLLPWMARSLVQSGYLVYPLPEINIIHPDWQIPEENAQGAAGWIRSWAKIATPDREAVEQMPLRAWAPVWYQNLVPLDRQILILDGAAVVLLVARLVAVIAYQGRKKGVLLGLHSPYAVLYLTVLLGITFWFFQAPAMRFGYGFLAILPVICLAPILMGILSRYPSVTRWGAPLVLVVLLLYQGVSVYRLADPAVLRPVVFLPADYPRAPVKPHTVGSLAVYTPEEGDQCWYASFPCVPAIDSAVRLRGDTMLDGFRSRP